MRKIWIKEIEGKTKERREDEGREEVHYALTLNLSLIDERRGGWR